MRYEIGGKLVSGEQFAEKTGVEIDYWSSDSTAPDDYIQFPMLGEKEIEGKPDYSEINLSLLDLMAERIAKNKHKYPKGNMLKPIDKQSLVQAAFRHIKKMMQPPKDDTETFEEHLAAVAVNMSALLTQIQNYPE